MIWWILLYLIFLGVLKADREAVQDKLDWFDFLLGFLIGPLDLMRAFGEFLRKKGVHIESDDH